MNFKVNTRWEELTLKITVQCHFKCRIRLKVYDFEKPKTLFTNRFKDIDGTETLYVRMPLSSQNIIISVYNEANGNQQQNQDSSFSVIEIDKIGLEKRTDLADILNLKVRSFVDLAQRFSFNASYLMDNQAYKSKEGRYVVQYKPYLINPQTGKKLQTPAMINNTTGRIQVSKDAFDNYTVPMRMMVLLHEFSHFYMNNDKGSEIEADLNGLLIYLSLGYPRIDAYEAFITIFIGTPSSQNKERYDIIDKFIRDFENKKIVMK